jgi:long-chain fatty acid transport protein
VGRTTKLLRDVGFLAVLFSSVLAHAGGMTLPARGARPLGRAGSFVAGADDASAIVYNPAGLAEIDDISILIDAGLVLQRVNYARVDSGGNPQPAVDGSIDVLPMPTAALTWKPRKLNGSLVSVIELAASFRINDHFYLGAGLQNMILKFKSLVQLSACTGLSCPPEDPGFDSLTELDATSGFTPSGIVGAQVVYPKIRGGLSLQLPFFIRGEGTVRSRLPTDPMFANASIVGEAVGIDFTIPLILRGGVEYRPMPTLRIELGFDYEAWSMQKNFAIQPKGIYLDNVPGIGRYYLDTMYVVRDLNDTFSIHVGGEYEVVKKRLVLRIGYLFETSATPDETASVLTADGLHNMITLGGSLRLGPVRFDLGYAHLFTLDRTVTNSRSLQLNPIQPTLAVAVGNGTYKIDTDIIAIGLNANF